MVSQSRRAGVLAFAIAAALPACAPLVPDQDDRAMQSLLSRHDLILLGEVHDNEEHHRIRLRWLQTFAESRPFVLVMEQFDTDRQADIDRARAAGLGARALAESAAFRFDGWQWRYYQGFVELAITKSLPLWAGNLPGSAAMAAARANEASRTIASPDPAWTPGELNAMRVEIREGHCNLMPAASIEPMMRAQMARDTAMAEVVARARISTGLPVMLIAGNGHVRKDLGVPRYLAVLRPQDRRLSVGLVEVTVDPSRYDRQVLVAAREERPDPCIGLRQRFAPRS